MVARSSREGCLAELRKECNSSLHQPKDKQDNSNSKVKDNPQVPIHQEKSLKPSSLSSIFPQTHEQVKPKTKTPKPQTHEQSHTKSSESSRSYQSSEVRDDMISSGESTNRSTSVNMNIIVHQIDLLTKTLTILEDRITNNEDRTEGIQDKLDYHFMKKAENVIRL